jgi:hypothetical protein
MRKCKTNEDGKREKEEKRKRDSKTDLLQLANDVFEAVYLFVTVERLGGVVPVLTVCCC